MEIFSGTFFGLTSRGWFDETIHTTCKNLLSVTLIFKKSDIKDRLKIDSNSQKLNNYCQLFLTNWSTNKINQVPPCLTRHLVKVAFLRSILRLIYMEIRAYLGNSFEQPGHPATVLLTNFLLSVPFIN